MENDQRKQPAKLIQLVANTILTLLEIGTDQRHCIVAHNYLSYDVKPSKDDFVVTVQDTM